MFIFPKYLPAKFLWQIWSHNLGFLKLIEILWSGTLLYACYSFNVYVFKIIFIQFFSYFLSKFGPQIWHSSDLLKFVTEVDCYMLTSILMFIFSKLLLFILFGQIWSQNLNFYKSTQIWYKRSLLYLITILMNICSNFLSVKFLGGKFGPIICSSTKWLKFRRGIHCCKLITILMFIFSKFLSFIFFWANLVSKSEILQIDWKLVQGYITICLLRF